jgi:hypothetical protein
MSDAFKKEVYMRAGVALEDEITEEEETLQYWQYLRSNYPYTPDGSNAHDHYCSESEVAIAERATRLALENKIMKRSFIILNVNILVTRIYVNMSDVHMTKNKVRKISYLLDKFMKITGKPWICGLQLRQWSVFLLRHWGGYLIPDDIQAVWTRIPIIGASFMHEFNMARDAGSRMPNSYPLDDGPISRNMPHIEQKCCESV